MVEYSIKDFRDIYTYLSQKGNKWVNEKEFGYEVLREIANKNNTPINELIDAMCWELAGDEKSGDKVAGDYVRGKSLLETYNEALKGLDINVEIELINEIIAQSIINGGDSGGPYYSNEGRTYLAIRRWLEEKGIEDKYKIIQDRYIDFDEKIVYSDIFMIVKREDPKGEYKIVRRPITF